jgi:hypothetical protein
MKLTTTQVQRLCGIEQTMCTLLLDVPVEAQFLTRKSDGTLRPADGRQTATRETCNAVPPRLGCARGRWDRRRILPVLSPRSTERDYDSSRRPSG